ncbi:MAG: hypothetical protein IPN32_19555 [Deltaproteobacteria bacterium]|nr:hypothetical protein [Deltaproteobacteria bacterium]
MPPPWAGKMVASPVTTALRHAIGASASATPAANTAMRTAGASRRLIRHSANTSAGTASSRFGRASTHAPAAMPATAQAQVGAPRRNHAIAASAATLQSMVSDAERILFS